MSQPLFYVHALLALLSLASSCWFLLHSKTVKDPSLSAVTSAIGFAVAGYLLCEISLNQSSTTAELVKFEKASTAIFIVCLGLFPWNLATPSIGRQSIYLAGHGFVALALIASNYLSKNSLRFETLQIGPQPTLNNEATFSTQTALLLALVVSTTIFLASAALQAKRNASTSKTLLLIILATTLILCETAETLAALKDKYPPNFEWIAVSLLGVTTFFWRFANQSENPQTPPINNETAKSIPPQPISEIPIQDEPEEFANYLQNALIFPLKAQESDFLSKILSNSGYQVSSADFDEIDPTTYFSDRDASYTLLFNRDSSDSLPPCIAQTSKVQNTNIFIIALSHDPHSPRILRELRDHRYHAAIKSPPKAMELYQVLSRQSLQRDVQIESELPNSSKEIH